jgi:hypothetical protein
MGIGTLIGGMIDGSTKRNDEDRALVQQNNSLQQQIAAIRTAGGIDTPAGREMTNALTAGPQFQDLMQRTQQRTFAAKDFEATTTARDNAVLSTNVKNITGAMVALKKSFTSPITGETDQAALDASEEYKQLRSSLGPMLARMNGQQPQQPGQQAQPRTADLFVAPKHDPMAYEPSPGETALQASPDTQSFRGNEQTQPQAPEAPQATRTGPQSELARQAPMMRDWWLTGWKGQGTTGKGPSDGTQEGGELDPLSALADQFVDSQSSRSQAMADGKAVVPNKIDQTDTTPKPMADHGIQDPDLQREFADFEKMVQDSVPDVDLRATYKQNPQSFAKLLAAIKKGVPDGKGGLKKLSMKEIVMLIQGMGR